MAKYCVQCGARLPDGVEICPDCNIAAQESDAALFTRMTAETEVWKEPESGRKKARRVRKVRSAAQTKKLSIAVFASAALIVILIVVFLAQPSERIGRALRAGEYDRAAEIYWSQSEARLANRSSAIDKKLLKAAETICAQFAARELDADTAAANLAKLGGFGDGAAQLLESQYAHFRTLSDSREHMTEAEKLSRNGEFLAAREEYLQVIEEDIDYADAQAKAEASIGLYAEDVLTDAAVFIQTGDYASAIRALEEGNNTLYTYGTFNADIDTKLAGCITLFNENTLADAEKLAELKDYDAAAELVRSVIEDYNMDTEGLRNALTKYEAQARAATILDAQERAIEACDAEDYALAFTIMDELSETMEPGEDVDTAVTALEARFSGDIIAAATAAFDGVRDQLPEAVELLENALKVRELDALEAYLAEISQYLPLKLAEAELLDKDGIILRTNKTFEGMDGTSYENWIWGDNGASLSFQLDGNYDVFEASFAMRTDDNRNANGHFIVYCDGEQVYKSPKLYHWQKDPIAVSVDISGCNELKISFVNDYNVNSAAGGYCYHGLCEAVALKNMPEMP